MCPENQVRHRLAALALGEQAFALVLLPFTRLSLLTQPLLEYTTEMASTADRRRSSVRRPSIAADKLGAMVRRQSNR